MLVLDGMLLNEFLATHSLVRFEAFDSDVGGQAAFLVVGSSTLNLKYLARSEEFTLQVILLPNGTLCYGVRVPDGTSNETLIWSPVETENELALLARAVVGKSFSVALMAEGAANVAKAHAGASECDLLLPALFEEAVSTAVQSEELSAAMSDTLELLGERRSMKGIAAVCRIRITGGWQRIESIFLRPGQSPETLDLFNADEGGQQEIIATWLLDTLKPFGAYRSPRLRDSPNRRELTDLLINHEFGDVLIESKAMGLLSRSELPSRDKLMRDTVKDVKRASGQLTGAAKQVSAGAVIVDQPVDGRAIEMHPNQPFHLIVLVSSLELLDQSQDFGRNFMASVLQRTNSFFHILDVAQLIRVVAAAQYFSARSTLTRMQWFDYFLIERAKKAVDIGHPNFDLRFLPGPD